MSDIKEGILITGITGFLGTALAKDLIKDYRVVGTGLSEKGIKEFQREDSLKSVKVYAIDIAEEGASTLDRIIRNHNIQYVVHAAALKHVGICENNPGRAIEVNVIGTKRIVDACVRNNIKNAIALSTDKAVNPLCTYGMTKKLTEELFLEAGYGVFQGVNFLFSSESVLDIWDKLRADGGQIKANKEAVRYFTPVQSAVASIKSNLSSTNRFSVEKCYKISIGDLQAAYSAYHSYTNLGDYIPLKIEKQEEELPFQHIDVVEPTIEEIVGLFKTHYGDKK